MTRQGEELFQAALNLQQEERAEMVARLMETLVPSDADPEVERAWEVELQRRAQRVAEHGPSGAEGDAVFDRVRRRIAES